jgi:hypothetical protein
MFEVDRTFYINNQLTGKIEWYFQAREGDSGYYESIEEARAMLKAFIKECIELKKTGGRIPGVSTHPNFNSGPRPKFKFKSKGCVKEGFIDWY